jgi:hypothetical protein
MPGLVDVVSMLHKPGFVGCRSERHRVVCPSGLQREDRAEHRPEPSDPSCRGARIPSPCSRCLIRHGRNRARRTEQLLPPSSFSEVTGQCGHRYCSSATVWILSKFATHLLGNPSASVSTTSVGILRIVGVMGATVTECKTAMAESRVKISTGRRLSGVLNVYQHTSPRFTRYPSPVRRAKCQIRRA